MDVQTFQLLLHHGAQSVLFVALHADGSVKRVGTSDLGARDPEVFAAVLREPLLARFMERFPETVWKLCGKTLTVTRVDLTTQRPEDIWVLRLIFQDETAARHEIGFQWAAASKDLPGEVPTLIQLALDVTEPWYQSARRGALRRRSLEEWNDRLASHPDNAEGLFYRGQLFCNRGLYELAVRDLTDSIRLQPGMLEPYLLRGQAYFFEGRYPQAVADFDRVLQVREDATAYLARGNSLAQMGAWDRAVIDYENVLRLEPDHAPARYHRARSYTLLDQPHRAIADYTDCLRIAPDNTHALYERLVCYQMTGQGEQARQDLKRASQLEAGLAGPVRA